MRFPVRFFKFPQTGTRHFIASLTMLGVVGIIGLTIALIFQTGDETVRMIFAGLGIFTLAAMTIAWQMAHIHFKRLERLHKAVIVAQSPNAERVVYGEADGPRDEIAQLHFVIDTLVRERLAVKSEINQRLEAVLSSIAEAVLVVTESGLVSLVNAGAKELLGADNVAVGTSIYAAVHTSSWEKAVDDTMAHGTAQDVKIKTLEEITLKGRMRLLDGPGGVTMVFESRARDVTSQVEHDLELHDTLPSPPALAPDLALSEMPSLVLDCETTGLEIEKEAVISVGGVRLHGGRIYRDEVIDVIINPGRPIPKASTAIHGITDDMVARAGAFDTIWPRLSALLQDTVLVGYNIGFDRAFLQKEATQAGLAWSDPLTLDVMLLYAALEPNAEKMSLDVVASSVGVQIEGRHTALGDALATAEVFTRMLPRLKAVNVTTLKDALDFQQRSKHIIAKQKEAGWHDGLNQPTS